MLCICTFGTHFFPHPPFSSFSLFIFYVFSHPFIVNWVLRGMKKSLNISLIFPIKNSSKNVRIEELWAISNWRFWRKGGNLREVLTFS